MADFNEFLNEQLKDPEFKREWDLLEPEMQIIEAMISARNEKHITQEILAKKSGIPREEISRLENGRLNPSVKFLKRLANGMDKKLSISFIDRV